ncbi:MAG: ABC transporter substrate-binding protein [Fibrobacter sp.]|nr:ABC transporter substrate-binding protein [Fibrobacter sp.]
MKRLNCLKLFLSGVLLCGMISCQKSGGESGEVDFPRQKTLYIAGFQWGDPNSFNPLSDWPAFPVGGNFNLMYEPLMVYNSLSGKMEALLASSYEESDDIISVMMDPRAMWSDGKGVTASDVQFTYEIGKRFPSAPTSFVWDYVAKITVDTIVDSANGGKSLEKVNFYINKVKRNNPLVVLDFLQAVRIVPAHYFNSLLDSLNGEFSELQKMKIDKDPVVSGPYNLLTYSGEKIVLKRRDNYWGNAALYANRLPKPEYIIHPIYKSNDAFSISLQQGNLDVSSTFIPRIWMKQKEGVKTWYPKEPYFVPAAMTMLVVNTTKYPLSDSKFRKAMAASIDYKDIREMAFSQYSPELQPGLVMPFGVEEKFYSKEDAEKYGVKFNLENAKKLLAEAGIKSVFGSDGNLLHMENSKGEKLPTLFIKSPAGWSDWEAMVRIAVQGMRKVGIDVREGFLDASLYWQAMPNGDFDLLMHGPSVSVTPSQPWSRFEAVMSSRNWKPVGEKMNENQGRYNNPSSKEYNSAVDSLLKLIPTITDDAQRVAAYRALNSIFMQEQPTIPLVYRPEQFYEFSTKKWTNFPTDENPYAPPQCLCFGVGTKSLWEIKSTAE